jgi:hypothetical protein
MMIDDFGGGNTHGIHFFTTCNVKTFRATDAAECVGCACERVCVRVSRWVSVCVARAIRRSDADRG